MREKDFLNLNTSVSNSNNNKSTTESRLKYDKLMAGGDTNSLNRKYSMDFLHQVGHQYKNITTNTMMTPKTQQQQQPQTQSQTPNSSPKSVDENNLIAMKMAKGDNNGYYNHIYAGGMYTNQILFSTQQQHQQQARYQQQHYQQQQQQRLRMFQRQDNNNSYPRVYQQDSNNMNRNQQQSQLSNSFSFPNNNNNRVKNNRKPRQNDRSFNNSINNNNNNNSITNNNNHKKHKNSSLHSKSSVQITSSDNKELPLTPTISLTPTQSDVKEWINKNYFTPINTNSGLSASAEQLNVRVAETPITIIKRPPSASGISSSTTTTPQLNQCHSIPRNYSLPTYDPSYPFDYYFARGERCEMREEPINLSCGSAWDHVSHEIWDKFQLFQQTKETYRSKMILWRDLYEYIRGFPLFQQRAFPKWGLFLVGSTMTGFGLDSSDVDMCLVLKTAPQYDPRAEAMITLSALKNYLLSSGSTFLGVYLINAKVPILRFRDSTNTIEVDLNYNNCIGVRNTHLLYCYAQLDWRLRPLAIIVKLWAQYHNINDARNSTISSYSLVLMVIHFLQSAISPPVLPCLHQKYPDKFQVLHDITTIDMMEKLETDWRSENYQSLGELFLRFLDYYSNFDYSHNAISIRTGGVLSIEECRSVKTPKNDPNHWQTLCIEEPFDLTNTARSTYDGEIFEKIKNVFFQSWRILREYKSLESLFQEQLFVQQTTIASQQYQIHNALNTQMLNEIKYYIYTPNPTTLSSSPIITANQMNSEITS